MINIYVGNLPYSTQEQDLIDHFSQWGEVDRATLVFDRETGRPRGFGFVEMIDEEEGKATIEAAHGAVMNGRPLTVNQARPRGSGQTETPTLTRTAVAGERELARQPVGRGYANHNPATRESRESRESQRHARPAAAATIATPRHDGPPRVKQGGYANYVYSQAS